jgi:hypothetical protein
MPKSTDLKMCALYHFCHNLTENRKYCDQHLKLSKKKREKLENSLEKSVDLQTLLKENPKKCEKIRG